MPPSPPPTQHKQLYNPDPDRKPAKPPLPPNMLINPLTGVEVFNFEEAILLYKAADVFYSKLGLLSKNVVVYGPICKERCERNVRAMC